MVGVVDLPTLRYISSAFLNLYLTGYCLQQDPGHFLSRGASSLPPTIQFSNYLLAVPGKTKTVVRTLDHAFFDEAVKGSPAVAGKFGDLRVMQCFSHRCNVSAFKNSRPLTA